MEHKPRWIDADIVPIRKVANQTPDWEQVHTTVTPQKFYPLRLSALNWKFRKEFWTNFMIYRSSWGRNRMDRGWGPSPIRAPPPSNSAVSDFQMQMDFLQWQLCRAYSRRRSSCVRATRPCSVTREFHRRSWEGSKNCDSFKLSKS